VSRELRAVLTGLNPPCEKTLAGALNIYLANLHVISTKLRNFHWNVVGVDFVDFHEKLQELYEEVALEIDRIAEQIKMLGFFPLASMREVDKFVRETTDEFTINLFGDARGFLEKHIWFFTAYLERMDGLGDSQNQ
jgi:starvation-inducible DNA-binding protein